MAKFLLVTVFFVLGTLRFGEGMSITNGKLSSADMKIIAQYPCEDAAIFNPEVVVRPGDSFDMTADVETQLDNTFKVLIQIDKFVGNKWQENFINTQGNMCDLLNKYGKRAWEKVRLAPNPQVTDSCVVPKGKYVLKNVSLSPTDFDIPTAFFGLFKIHIRLHNPEGELFMCQIVEMETQKG